MVIVDMTVAAFKTNFHAWIMDCYFVVVIQIISLCFPLAALKVNCVVHILNNGTF